MRKQNLHDVYGAGRSGADRCQAESNETPRCAERSAPLAGARDLLRTAPGTSARRKSHFTRAHEGQVTRRRDIHVDHVENKPETKIKRRARVYNTVLGTHVRGAMSSRRTDVSRPRRPLAASLPLSFLQTAGSLSSPGLGAAG